MPSHRMNSGTQAIDGIERSACRRRIEQAARQRRIAGDRAGERAGRDAEAQSRPRRGETVTRTWRCSSPAAASSTSVAQMREGGGTRRPSEKPSRTAISQRIARPDRQREAERGLGVARKRARLAPARGRVRRCSWRKETWALFELQWSRGRQLSPSPRMRGEGARSRDLRISASSSPPPSGRRSGRRPSSSRRRRP